MIGVVALYVENNYIQDLLNGSYRCNGCADTFLRRGVCQHVRKCLGLKPVNKLRGRKKKTSFTDLFTEGNVVQDGGEWVRCRGCNKRFKLKSVRLHLYHGCKGVPEPETDKIVPEPETDEIMPEPDKYHYGFYYNYHFNYHYHDESVPQPRTDKTTTTTTTTTDKTVTVQFVPAPPPVDY
jgi:hypothetical protein